MKKLMLFGLGALASISVLTSCKKDEVIPEGPKVNFVNGATYEAKATDTSYTFIASIEAAGELKEIKLFDVSNVNNETQMGTTITKFDSDTKHTLTQKVDLAGKTGDLKIKVSVTDKKDQTNSSIITIKTYKAPAGDILSYDVKIMGAQYNNGVGSFFSTSNGKIYTASEASNNVSLIDFVYCYRGETPSVIYKAMIGAPSDAEIKVGHASTTGFSSWSNPNNTLFKKTSLKSTDFDSMVDDSEISKISDLTETHVLNLIENEIIAFKTVAGKLGYFRVKKINQAATGSSDFDKFQRGSIEIDVKVQK